MLTTPSIRRLSFSPIAAFQCQVSVALSVLVAAFTGICVSKRGGDFCMTVPPA